MFLVIVSRKKKRSTFVRIYKISRRLSIVEKKITKLYTEHLSKNNKNIVRYVNTNMCCRTE